MTLAAGSNPEDNDKAEGGVDKSEATGRALEASQAAAADESAESSMEPFLAATRERAELPPPPRAFYSKLLDYSAHAAMIVGLLGFAWTISDHVAKPAPDAAAPVKMASAAPAMPANDEAADLRRSTQKMEADISALRLSLEALRGSVRQDKTADQIRSLAANLDGVKTNLNASKSETGAALAQLATKIDHLPHSEAVAKLQQIADRLDRMEREQADKTVTASIAPATATPKATPVALPPVKPQVVAKATPDLSPDAAKKAALDKVVLEGDTAKKPPVIAEWVVRDVYDGVAIVESKHGPMEVVPGVTIPGAGVVKSIDRHGAGWTVTTSKGQIAYMPAPRERQQHGYYRTVPEDF